MARPARVRIRIRKPCFFARLRLFGWNVRFTGRTPLGRSWWKAGKDPVRRWHRSTDGTGLRKQASTRPVGRCLGRDEQAAPASGGYGRDELTGTQIDPFRGPERLRRGAIGLGTTLG